MKPNFLDYNFQKWAFGLPDDFEGYIEPSLQALELWNARHSNLLELKPDSIWQLDFLKMWDFWLEHKKIKKTQEEISEEFLKKNHELLKALADYV